MKRTAWIVLSVVTAVTAVACKSGSSDAPAAGSGSAAKPAPPPEPRIPSGPVPVALPTLEARYARRVQSAATFVTIAKNGTLAGGPLAPGPTPYAGKPLGDDASLDDALFAPPPAVAAAGSGSAAGSGGVAAGSGSAAGAAPRGQYHMQGPADDTAAARQQAIEAARNAGVLGNVQQGGAFATLTGTGDINSGFDDTNIYGGLLGNEAGEVEGGFGMVRVTGTLEAIGVLDALVLADRAGLAPVTVDVLARLGERRTSIAVEGTGAPDAVQYRFGKPPTAAPTPAAVTVTFVSGELAVTNVAKGTLVKVVPVDGSVRDPLAAALRPDPMVPVEGAVELSLSGETTVQQLVDVLGALAAAAVTEVRVAAPASGGGGTGWGTIGTGRYGTIGHGAGTGYGVGGDRAGVPKVAIGQPNAVGDLDKAIIRRYVKRSIMKITYCYEKQLLAKPGLEGTVTAQFFIAPSGAVTTATASGVDPEVASCVADVIKTIEFPKPKGGGGVQVNYPFTFRPADGG